MYDAYLERWSQSLVRLNDIRQYHLDEGERQQWTAHSGCVFVQVISGEGEIRLAEHTYPVQPGLVLHSGPAADLACRATTRLVVLMIRYSIQAPPSCSAKEASTTGRLLHVNYAFNPGFSVPAYERLLQLHHTFHRKTARSRIASTGQFYQLVLAWFAHLDDQGDMQSARGVAGDAMEQIVTHYQEDVTLSWIADKLSCSERHLSKQFKLHWGISPIRALTRIRMYKAAVWLGDGDASLQDIAVSIGYMNGYTLSRLFKENFGLTAGQYRQLYRNGQIVRDPTNAHTVSGIVTLLFSPYNDNENQNHKEQWGRTETMAIRSKKVPTIAALLLGATVLLSACSDDNAGSANHSPANANNEPQVASESEPTESSAPASNTKLFSDALGEREIPVRAQRIYSFGATNSLVALDIIPVGAPQYEVQPDYYLSNLPQAIPIVGDYPPNYEAIMETNPDLIITPDINIIGNDREAYYEGLSKIAPVATYEWFGQDIYDQLRQVAEIVDKQEEAENWIAAHMARVEVAKGKMGELVGPDETVAIIWIRNKTFSLVGNRNIGHVLYTLLGLKPLLQVEQAIADNGGDLVGINELSFEHIPEITADHIVVMVQENAEGAEETYTEMVETALWKSLPAAQNGNVYRVPHDKWWAYSVLAADHLLDEAIDVFTK